MRQEDNAMSHLTLADRSEIENGLRSNRGFSAIARTLKKARSTVMREILSHRIPSDKGAKGRVTNRCINRCKCDRKYLCAQCVHPMSRMKCSSCSKCNSVCHEFVELSCPRLDKSPYVCNGCGKEGTCVLHKWFYIASDAQKAYERTLSSCRQGAAITEEERRQLTSLLAGGMRKGQSLHHIVSAHPDSFAVCERTLYDYIHSGILQPLGPLDLPDAPKMKPRRKKGVPHKVKPRCAEGRGREEFLKFMRDNPEAQVVEMDSVFGVRGGKLLLTLQFDACAAMLAFLRDANTSQSVIDIFDGLERLLGLEVFRSVFPVLLTDNGTEFSNPGAIERSVDGESVRTRVFYCDPYAAWQKPNVENNHRNLRRILPKGESMDFLTQEKVNLALSHMNSVIRASLGNVTAARRFAQCYGEDVLEKLGIGEIAPDQVRMTPELVRD